MKAHFPISFNGQKALTGDICDYCHKGCTSREFVSFAVGATQDLAGNDAVNMSHTEASMSFGWQGAVDRLGTGFEVLSDTVGGSACLNFCSTRCLRSFLNECVDHLELLIKKTKSRN